MAYDRYDPRDERWSGRDRERFDNRGERSGRFRETSRDSRNERGFFERAGDEIASWFGDDDAEQRRRRDHRGDHGEARFGHEPSRSERDRFRSERQRNHERGFGRFRPDPDHDRERSFRESDRSERGYRPITGDYGRAAMSDDPWSRDPYRITSRAGSADRSDRSRHEAERGHQDEYRSWRSRHMVEMDRDYDEYRRERQSHFDKDFGSWREQRQHKRGLLGQIREHMEVLGKDHEHVGKVDKVAGDRIILAKSDPESGGSHHSLNCTDIERIEGNRIILECKADEAKQRWRDEKRERALFEREDQGEAGPHMLNRSFEGTYR